MAGSITGRDDFLNHLYGQLKTEPQEPKAHPFEPINNLPHETLGGLSTEELLEVAKERAPKINAGIVETTAEGLEQTLKDEIVAFGGGEVLVPTDDRFADFGLGEFITSSTDDYSMHQWQIGAENREANIAQAQKSNVSIAFAEFLLAESCSVVVENHAGQGRTLHFLPTHYLSIVPESKIVARTTQWADHYQAKVDAGEKIGSDVNIISGPSNSGDIEMVLVTGLHGPIEVKYVVVKGK